MAEPTEPKPEPTPPEPQQVTIAPPDIHVPGDAKLFVHPLDMLDQQSAEQMKDLEKTILHTEEPPAEEPPKEEPTPAPAEEPPEAPREEPPAEQPPKEAAPERPKRWKQLREANRAAKAAEARAAEEAQRRAEVEAQLAAREPPKDDSWYQEPEIDDPLTKVNKELEGVRKTLAEQAEANKQNEIYRQQQAIRDQVLRDEANFRGQKPDYNEALQYLVESRRQEYDTMGLLDHGAEQWLTNQEEIVKRHASETGKDPTNDDELYEAARDLAFNVLIDHDRQAILAGSKTLGKTVPERIYTLATARGYAARESAAVVAPPAATAPADKAQERVRAAVAAQSATQSLSALQSNAAPRSREIRTRDDVLKLSEQEIDELDRKKPGWDRLIFG